MRHSRWLPWICAALLLPSSLWGQGLDDLYRAGAEAFQRGDAQRAIEMLSTVAAQQPGHRDVQMLLGQSYLVASRPREAKQHFEAALRADPQNGLATFLLGFSLYQAARYVEAIEVLERARDLAPGNPNPSIYRGLSWLKTGQPEEARIELIQALDLAPDDPTAQAAMAELELSEGDAAGAEARLGSVVQTMPTVEHRLLLARARLESGRPEDAVPLLRQLDDELPERSDVLYLLAQSLLRSGQTDAGRSILERFRRQRAVEERLRVLEATVSTSPEDHASRLELTRLLIDDGQANRARDHLRILERQVPSESQLKGLRQDLARLSKSGS